MTDRLTPIVIVGARGRMGKTLLREIIISDSMVLEAAVDRTSGPGLGQDAGRLAGLHDLGLAVTDELRPRRNSVVVDFSLPQATDANLRRCQEAGVPLVLGTTGLHKTTRDLLRAAAKDIAIVSAANFGGNTGTGLGQIRLNEFTNRAEWELREYKTLRTCVGLKCDLTLAPLDVAANPADVLVGGTHPQAAAFQAAFVDDMLPGLLAPTIPGIALAVPRQWNAWESISHHEPEEPRTTFVDVAGPDLRAAIETKLGALGSALTTDDVLARASTQTCSGCHEMSSDAPLGGGLTWPASNGFTHVDEAGVLSPALTEHLLPARKAILADFIASRCAPPAARVAPLRPAAPGLTLGGHPVGAPN